MTINKIESSNNLPGGKIKGFDELPRGILEDILLRTFSPLEDMRASHQRLTYRLTCKRWNEIIKKTNENSFLWKTIPECLQSSVDNKKTIEYKNKMRHHLNTFFVENNFLFNDENNKLTEITQTTYGRLKSSSGPDIIEELNFFLLSVDVRFMKIFNRIDSFNENNTKKEFVFKMVEKSVKFTNYAVFAEMIQQVLTLPDIKTRYVTYMKMFRHACVEKEDNIPNFLKLIDDVSPEPVRTTLKRDLLFWATEESSQNVIIWLIENGTPVDSKTVQAYTALMLAVEDGNVEISKLLVGFGANISLGRSVMSRTTKNEIRKILNLK